MRTLSHRRFPTPSNCLEMPSNPRITDLIKGLDNQPIDIPDTTAVCLHVSAGLDFRSLVYYSDGYLSSHKEVENLTRPTCHIYTCLPVKNEEQGLMDILTSDDKLLFEDDRTRIRIKSHQMITVTDPRLWSNISRRYCHIKRGEVFAGEGADGFVAEVELVDIKSGYTEMVSLIYLLTENHATYHYLTQLGVGIKNIVATCEGLAFGGCGMTIFASVCECLSDKLETVVIPERGQARKAIGELENAGRVSVEGMGHFIGGGSVVFRISQP